MPRLAAKLRGSYPASCHEIVRYAHIVNPVKAAIGSDLRVAQPITFESMRVAAGFASGSFEVQAFSAQYAEDRSVVPAHITPTRDLERSAADVGEFRLPRKLPLIGDIMSRLQEASPDADIYSYTNVDIALVPHFYTSVDALMQDHDAVVINRRTIPATYDSVDELHLMYACAGKPHPGFDCFVFRAELMDSLRLGHSLIGAPWVGTSMVCNLAQCCSSFALFEDLHLTFHIGDDRAWRRAEYDDYRVHNRREFLSSAEAWFASCSESNPLVAKMYRRALAEEEGNGPSRRRNPIRRLARGVSSRIRRRV